MWVDVMWPKNPLHIPRGAFFHDPAKPEVTLEDKAGLTEM